MKIGIITYHFCQNYGAVLQCYALQKYIQSIGLDCYVLDAISSKQKKNNSLYSGKQGMMRIIRNAVLLPLHFQRKEKKKKFEKFVGEQMNLSSYCSNCNELRDLIMNNKFDVIIAGSDQVWNPANNDFDEMFFFPFECKAKKIGYAISLGSATKEDLVSYKDYIGLFDTVTAREESACPILTDFTRKTVEQVVDPALLIGKDHWLKLAQHSTYPIKGKYVVCYLLNKAHYNDYYTFSKRIADNLGAKLISIETSYGFHSFRKNTLIDLGPYDFLSIIKNASFICTDSFHGTVFASVFNVPFCSLIAVEKEKDTRVKDYLYSVGLKDRMVLSNELSLDHLHFEKSDGSKVERTINELTIKSKIVLKSLLR